MKTLKKLYKKYKTFIKYILSAGISFTLDLTLFTIFNIIFERIIPAKSVIVATITARIISSIINYHINRNAVFSSDKNNKFDKSSFAKYVTLVIIQMLVSSFSVQIIHNITKINATLIKIPIECILFLCNYFIQKLFIFKEKTQIN